MERYIVEGLKRLNGEMEVHGAKNAALPILAASLLCDSCELHNCPELSDIGAARNILEHLGCTTKKEGDTLIITGGEGGCTIPDQLMREMRSSIVFLGAILAKYRQASLTFPGGCELGPRPIDLHIGALKRLGVTFQEEGGSLRCTVKGKLHGASISLPFPSVGATENIMLAASLAQGHTVIRNAAREPEIADLAAFLNSAGAKISTAADGTIHIDGVKKLGSAVHTVIPDRIVGITYLCCGAITQGDLLVRKVNPEHFSAVLPIFEEMGCQLRCGVDAVHIRSSQRLRAVKSIATMPYPGFPTDALAPIMALTAVAEGTSVFTENIFQNRYKQAWELERMGADIKTEGRVAIVRGVPALHSAQVCCTDLRGGASLVIAALAAQGQTVIHNVKHIVRGYQDLDYALNRVGASIARE